MTAPLAPRTSTPRIVGRLAPSPTGALHLGHAHAFVLAWLHARSQGGEVRLRLEDLDSGRARTEFIDETLRDLSWLGLDWDGPVLRQSERIGAIQQAAYGLLARGLAYPCCCSRSDIRQALSAPHAGDDEPVYPGTCRGRFVDLQAARTHTGTAAGLRFAVDSRSIRFVDSIHGQREARLDQHPGDFLILRRDGIPAYQLSVVVDDAFQGVTDVVRGADLLDSTPRQLALIDALGLPSVRHHHVPLIVDDTGKRLAKRDNSRSLAALRQAGVDPRRVITWVAHNCGMNVSELVRVEDLVASFSLSKLGPEPVMCPQGEWYQTRAV